MINSKTDAAIYLLDDIIDDMLEFKKHIMEIHPLGVWDPQVFQDVLVDLLKVSEAAGLKTTVFRIEQCLFFLDKMMEEYQDSPDPLIFNMPYSLGFIELRKMVPLVCKSTIDYRLALRA